MEHVIIIGAGMAGLAAARALRAAGHDPLLIEARTRYGGRIWTDKRYGPVELGAEFIHGDRAATWAAVHAAGLRISPWGSDRRFAWGGQIAPGDDPRAQRVVELLATVTAYAGPDVSAAALLADHAAPADPALTLALRWLANLEAADPAHLSAAAFARERATSSNGEGNFHLLDGYASLLDYMAADLRIRLSSPVEQINWDAEGVALELAGGERLAARRVIITLPLSLLQAGQPRFTPALPVAKQQAISAIPMGQVTKLALWFERQLWPDFTVLSTDGRIATWWPVESATTPTLMGYQGGPLALAVADPGEAAAIELALDDLAQLFGSGVRAACLGGYLADWSRDPWSRGAYSYSTLAMGDARTQLAAPVAGSLYFAGEATAKGGHLATVHGAMETGQRAAAEVLAAIEGAA